MLIKRAYQLPLSCTEINRKVAAWREVFGNNPTVTISGDICADNGRLAYPRRSEIVSFGRKYLTARLDGELVRLDPTRCEPGMECYIILEGKIR